MRTELARASDIPLPPHDAELERDFLSALLTEPGIAGIGLSALGESVLYVPGHRRVYRLLADLHALGQLDFSLARAEARTRGIEGFDTIAEAKGQPGCIEKYAARLRELAGKRRVQTAAATLLEMASNGASMSDLQGMIKSLADAGDVDADLGVVAARGLLDNPPPTPPEIIKGIAFAGSKISLSSNSKGRKTWLQLHLGLCIATGTPWLGHETTRGNVLYVNLELQPFSVGKRLAALEKALGIQVEDGALDLLNLRGKKITVEQLRALVYRHVARGHYSLIITDPLYKLLGGRSENSAEDMGDLLSHLESMAADAGAALLVAHHFAKGAAGNKNALDRASGSGVVARDGDSILVLTEHEELDAVTLECILRDLPPVEPRALRWEFPIFKSDETLEPCKHAQAGRPKKWTLDNVKAACNDNSYSEAVNALVKATKIDKRTAERAISSAVEKGQIRNFHGIYSRVEK